MAHMRVPRRAEFGAHPVQKPDVSASIRSTCRNIIQHADDKRDVRCGINGKVLDLADQNLYVVNIAR